MNSFLKSYKMLAFAALLLALQAQAQAPMLDSVKADRVSLKRDGSYLTVGMTLRLSEVEAEGDRAVLITPLLEKGDTNKALRPIGIYSRNRYFHYARQGKGRMLGGADELSFKEKDKPDTLAYQVILPYEEWMDGASLTLFRQDYGCCGKVLAEQSQAIGEYRGKRPEFIPLMVYVQPEVERTKTRALAGTAYIDFPVSRTEIRPGASRQGHHRHFACYQGIRLARRLVCRKCPFGSRTYRSVARICFGVVPFRRRVYPHFFRTGRLGRLAPLCRRVGVGTQAGNLSHHRQR